MYNDKKNRTKTIWKYVINEKPFKQQTLNDLYIF